MNINGKLPIADIWPADENDVTLVMVGNDMRTENLLVLQTERYTAYIQKEYTRIGCKYHKNEDWLTFDDDAISKMADDALAWWKNYGSIVKDAIKALQEGVA